MSNKFRRFSITDLGSAELTSVMTVPSASTALLKSAIVANKSGGTRNVKMLYTPVTDAGTGTDVMSVSYTHLTLPTNREV